MSVYSYNWFRIIIISNKNWDSGKNSGLTIAINGSDNDIRLNLGNGGTRADCNVSLPSNYREGWMHIIAVVDRERGRGLVGICDSVSVHQAARPGLLDGGHAAVAIEDCR